jgi:hypothetical protein
MFEGSGSCRVAVPNEPGVLDGPLFEIRFAVRIGEEGLETASPHLVIAFDPLVPFDAPGFRPGLDLREWTWTA